MKHGKCEFCGEIGHLSEMIRLPGSYSYGHGDWGSHYLYVHRECAKGDPKRFTEFYVKYRY